MSKLDEHFLKQITVEKMPENKPAETPPVETVLADTAAEPVKLAETSTAENKPAEPKLDDQAIPIGEPEKKTEPIRIPIAGEPEKRGRGRPRKDENASKTYDQLPVELRQQIEMSAAMTFDLATGSLTMLFQDEGWKAKTAEERQAMIDAIARYYNASGMVDIPPGWALVIAVTAYSIPRFTAPTTAQRIKGFFLWCKLKIGGLFAKWRK